MVRLKVNLLVMRCQVGDHQAFKELYNLFGSLTLRLLQSYIKNEEASDLNQEVWLTIYQRISSLNETDRFKYWLYQVTRNKAIDYYRKNKRTDYFDESTYLVNQLSDLNEDARDLINHKRIHLARKNLSPKLNEVIELYYFHGMDYKEVSLIVGCSMGTVKSRIHSAKNKIREWLTKN